MPSHSVTSYPTSGERSDGRACREGRDRAPRRVPPGPCARASSVLPSVEGPIARRSRTVAVHDGNIVCPTPTRRSLSRGPRRPAGPLPLRSQNGTRTPPSGGRFACRVSALSEPRGDGFRQESRHSWFAPRGEPVRDARTSRPTRFEVPSCRGPYVTSRRNLELTRCIAVRSPLHGGPFGPLMVGTPPEERSSLLALP